MFMPYANNKGADQSANLCSLISTFIVRCLVSTYIEISKLLLVSVAEQAGLSFIGILQHVKGFSYTDPFFHLTIDLNCSTYIYK